jgi:hypothetical protein
VHNLLADPAVAILALCFLLSVAKFATGTWRAWVNGVFHIPALKDWITSDGDALFKITFWVILAKLIGLFDLSSIGTAFGLPPSALTALGGGGLMIYAGLQAASYIASTFGSIKDNMRPPDAAQVAAKVEKAALLGDPIPGTNPVPPTASK